MKHVILDVETQKTFDDVGGYYPEKLLISFVGVIVRDVLPTTMGEQVKEKRLELFEQDLDKLWRVLETADVIIGFNLDSFDMQTFKPYYNGDVTQLPTWMQLLPKHWVRRNLEMDLTQFDTIVKANSMNLQSIV